MLEAQSTVLSNLTIFAVVMAILSLAAFRRVALFDTFVEGAKEGFQVAVGIIPYLIAMLIAIGVLRASGTLDFALSGVRWMVEGVGLDTRWVDGLPTALMRPLSGSGARGLMLETMETHGADSFAGRLVLRPPRQHRDDFLRSRRVLRVRSGSPVRATRCRAVSRPISRGSWRRSSSTYLFFG